MVSFLVIAFQLFSSLPGLSDGDENLSNVSRNRTNFQLYFVDGEQRVKESGAINEDARENFYKNCRLHIKGISYSLYCKLSKRE